MTEDRKQFILKAETGHFKVVPGTSSLAANTAIIARESLSSPGEMSVISPALALRARERPSLPPGTLGLQRRDDARDDPNAIVLSRHFKLVFISVLAITVLAGLAEIVMASIWGTSPTQLQLEVFSAMGFAWKAGFGAIIGLFGGKLT
jgi:hypothetical protein